jgi:hypothetical protein
MDLGACSIHPDRPAIMFFDGWDGLTWSLPRRNVCRDCHREISAESIAREVIGDMRLIEGRAREDYSDDVTRLGKDINDEWTRLESITGSSRSDDRRARFVLWRLYRYHGLALTHLQDISGLDRATLHNRLGQAFKEACLSDNQCFWKPFL